MELYFDGQPLQPIASFIIAPSALPGRTLLESAALRYVWREVKADKEYISLRRMSRLTGLSYDQCDNYMAKFSAERVIPRLTIFEEGEG